MEAIATIPRGVTEFAGRIEAQVAERKAVIEQLHQAIGAGRLESVAILQDMLVSADLTLKSLIDMEAALAKKEGD
ncbi:hypothetical protein BC830DRAFT_1175489, partial [Chytriomyces sp. MP71]